MGFLLFIIAYILFLPLSVLNYVFLKTKKGYFKSSAMNLDKYANREFRSLFNQVLINSQAYPFGNEKETISMVLGKNQLNNTLTQTGKSLVWILDKIDKNHVEKSIEQ